MFKFMFNNFVQFSIFVVQDKEFDDVCRQNVLEFMVIFVDYVLFMCCKDFFYINDMIIQCFSFMIDFGEDDDDVVEWFSLDDVS